MPYYCPDCGGTGVKIDGAPCSCLTDADTIFGDFSCVEVPEQYHGMRFDSELLPKDIGTFYPKFMQELYQSVSLQTLRNKNTLVCSPPCHGKTILAYCCIQALFRKKIPVSPLYDILEIRRMSAEFEANKIDDSIYRVPYLFVKIPVELGFYVYSSILSLIDRRVRRGNSTIFLYNGSWNQLTTLDTRSLLTSLRGDGAFMTIDVKSFTAKTT